MASIFRDILMVSVSQGNKAQRFLKNFRQIFEPFCWRKLQDDKSKNSRNCCSATLLALCLGEKVWGWTLPLETSPGLWQALSGPLDGPERGVRDAQLTLLQAGGQTLPVEPSSRGPKDRKKSVFKRLRLGDAPEQFKSPSVDRLHYTPNSKNQKV